MRCYVLFRLRNRKPAEKHGESGESDEFYIVN